MNIRLVRNQDRALFLPASRHVADCPLDVRRWLGQPQHEDLAEIREDTPMLGISPTVVLEEMLLHGFCALDLNGIVREFDRIGTEHSAVREEGRSP